MYHITQQSENIRGLIAHSLVNRTIGEKFRNCMELYNVMEFYVFQNELFILGFKRTILSRR